MGIQQAPHVCEESAGCTAVPSSLVRKQVDRLLGSSEFDATDAQRAFLQFIIDKTLIGHTHEIKGYTIATQVFGRNEDFDQARDPIVSIQANKLRRALERYYLVEGYNDPVAISIPKGGYVPVFKRQIIDTAGGRDSSGEPPAHTHTWPAIIIQSLENHTGEKELDYVGGGIATEIALEITRYQEIRVVRQTAEAGRSHGAVSKARFILGGSMRKSGNNLKVTVTLTDLTTGVQIWGDAFRSDLDPATLVEFEEKVAATVVSMISCESGIIIKTLSPETSQIPPLELETHQAMLRFYQFQLDFSPHSFLDVYRALHQACRNEPGCGLAWSMLARLYALNYSLELFDLETPIDEAATFAEKSVRLEPANQRVRIVLAFVLLFKNELAAGLAETDHALELNPNSLICLDNIGYLKTLFGDWNQGPALIAKAIELNPYYNITVHYGLWLNRVRQEQYDRAHQETLHFGRPALFWDPLLKAATFGLSGRIEEGSQAGNDLVKIKPGFQNAAIS